MNLKYCHISLGWRTGSPRMERSKGEELNAPWALEK